MTDPAKTSADAPPAADVDEFAHIKSPRLRHPLLAAAAAALAFYLVFHVRRDLRYTLSSTEPLELGDARAAFGAGREAALGGSGIDNRYVRVHGTPDRESALELDTKGSWVFSQFFRILGTGDRLFVHRRESPLPAFRAEADVFEGRMIRFSDLSFESAIRRYFEAHVAATHFFAPDDLGRAVAAQPGTSLALRDLAGDEVTLGPGDVLTIDISRPEHVQVALPRDRFPTEAAARAAVEGQGGEVAASQGLAKDEPSPSAPSSGPLSLVGGVAPTERWVFVARFAPHKRDAALSALGELDRKVAIRDARETVRARLGDLRAELAGRAGAALVLDSRGGGPRLVPVASIAAVRTLAAVKIPPDAYLVIEADHPRDHLPTLLLALVIAMFGAVNLVGLVRELLR